MLYCQNGRLRNTHICFVKKCKTIRDLLVKFNEEFLMDFPSFWFEEFGCLIKICKNGKIARPPSYSSYRPADKKVEARYSDSHIVGPPALKKRNVWLYRAAVTGGEISNSVDVTKCLVVKWNISLNKQSHVRLKKCSVGSTKWAISPPVTAALWILNFFFFWSQGPLVVNHAHWYLGNLWGRAHWYPGYLLCSKHYLTLSHITLYPDCQLVK